jgi:hypothetical protein
MNERDDDRTETIRQIAAILAAVYLRLRFPEQPPPRLDSPETESAHGTAG